MNPYIYIYIYIYIYTNYILIKNNVSIIYLDIYVAFSILCKYIYIYIYIYALFYSIFTILLLLILYFPGYTGTLCENGIGECRSSPCQNNAVCDHRLNAYSCKCRKFYNGTNCQNRYDFCTVNAC